MRVIEIDNDVNIPILGFGTYRLTSSTLRHALEIACEAGYRHIDTADRYQNHKDIAKFLQTSGIGRKDFFITTKVWYTDLYKNDLIVKANSFLDELGSEYIDLLLVHWPNRSVPVLEIGEAMERLKDGKIIRSWGVSNYNENHLKDLLAIGYKPAVNQIEVHPSFSQKNLRKFCLTHKIAVEAYSPVAQGQDLNIPELTEVAAKYDATQARVILAWICENSMIALPSSSDREHIEDNFKSLSLKLDPQDLLVIDGLNRDNRINAPAFADFNY